MVRSGTPVSSSLILLLFLVLLPPPARAQAVEGQTRTHVVRAGETLTSIAVEYLGSAGEWRRILQANEDRIERVDRIPIGMELVIPDFRVSTSTAGAEILEIRPAGTRQGDFGIAEAAGDGTRADPGEEAALRALRDRQAMARYSRFEPDPAPEYGGERTVFYQHPALARRSAAFQGWTAAELPAVPREIRRSSGWLLRPGEELLPLGGVPAFAGDPGSRHSRTTIQHRDRVRGVFTGQVPEIGEGFLVVRIDREIPGVGTIIVPTGRAVVRQLHEAGAILEVVGEYDRLELGQLLVADRDLRSEPLGAAEPTEEHLEATVLAFEREREVRLPNDRAFLDVGRTQGVRLGDEFVVLLGAENGWGGRVGARFQVVDVREETSTVRILGVTSREIRPGLEARLDRRIP